MKKTLCCILSSLFMVLPLKAEISNQTLAILVNINDPESIEIANYYQKARLIPDANVIYLRFKPGASALTEEEFNNVETQLKKKVSNKIQAYALAWRKPWRVSCMSVTSAFSLGFDKKYCATGCKLTKPIKYFNSQSRQPFTDYKIRPSMMLSAGSVKAVKDLIDKGVLADDTRPVGAGYLINTSDANRNVRSAYYPAVKKMLGSLLNVELVKADAIKHKDNVMFYFTGLKKVKWLDENKYLPGAIADHLTSAGGVLFDGYQMS
ncbi:MAG: TIGR03790 family protein, partial [Methylococcales bacterium]